MAWRDQYTNYGSYESEVARGKIAGARPFYSFGEIDTLGAVTDHMVWPMAGTPALTVPTGIQMNISSTSVNDASAGTGIRTVKIHYLDTLLNEQNEVVTMNGTSAVNTVATDIKFVNSMHIMSGGTSKDADGVISLKNGAVTYAQILTNKRRCSSSVRRVPKGKRLMITSLYGASSSGTATTSAIVRLVTTGVNDDDFTSDSITFPHAGIAIQDTSATISLIMPFPVEEGQVVGLEVTTDKSAMVDAGFMGWIEDV